MMDFTVHPDFLKDCGYCVYEHVFPDGRRYIGISKDAKKRWRPDGKGYDAPKLKEAIDEVGWDNIEHNIIVKFLPKRQAQNLEKYLIEKLDTIENGFNTRTGGEASCSLFSSHVTQMLSILRRSPIPKAKEFAEMMEGFANHEGAAYRVNLIDYVLRTEVDYWQKWYSREDAEWMSAAWVYYIKEGIAGKDIREIQPPHEAIWKEIKQ